MNRTQQFFTAVAPPFTVRDSRFGLRKFVGNPEQPSIFSYASPGKGPNGESSN
jgi:hypothetical protein